MGNETKNNTYYENLSLEEAIEEHASCFDDSGNLINQEKISLVLKTDYSPPYIFIQPLRAF